MPRALYAVTAVVAAGRCVPRDKDRERTFRRYRRLAAAATTTRPMFVAFTEAWFTECRDGIKAGLPEGYGLLAPLGNSAILAYDTRQVRFARTPRTNRRIHGTAWLHGLVAGRWGLASDPRRMPWGLFVILGTGRKLRVGAYHCTPRRRSLGDDAVRATNAAQTRARNKANKVMRGYYPGLVLGDFNNTHPGIGTKSVGVADDPIIRAAVSDGANVAFGGFRTFDAPPVAGFDHLMLRVVVPVVARAA